MNNDKPHPDNMQDPAPNNAAAEPEAANNAPETDAANNAPETPEPDQFQQAESQQTETPQADNPQAGTSKADQLAAIARKILAKVKPVLKWIGKLFSRGSSSLIGFILRLCLIAAVLLGLLAGLGKITSGESWIEKTFKRKPIEILPTQNIVIDIHKIAQLNSASYCCEYFMRDAKGVPGSKNKDSVYYIIYSHVYAGFDLSLITENDIKNDGYTLDITIPPVEIFDVVINPSDCIPFDEKGTWNQSERNTAIALCRPRIKELAIKHGLLTRAENHGKAFLEDLFLSAGYRKVNIHIAPKAIPHSTTKACTPQPTPKASPTKKSK